jgi:hypothetical protein
VNQADITAAMGKHLAALDGVPAIVWENKDKPDSVKRPYIQIQMVRVSRSSVDLAGGGGVTSRGYMQATVVSEIDQFATPAEATADSIAAHFRKGVKLSENGGTVTIMDAPNILTGFRDGPDWRIPVQIDYWAN